MTPLKKWLEKLVSEYPTGAGAWNRSCIGIDQRDADTRMLSWFSPCIWGDADGYTGMRRFYHGSAIGRAIANCFWSILGNDVLALNKYDAHPETKKLKPWSDPMFTGCSLSILNYPADIFDFVRNGTVKVHIADVTGLSRRTVHLSDGTQLDTDALCCVTGWKHVPPIKFLPEGIDREIGLPHAPVESPLFTAEAVERADREILSRFPRLRDQPVQNRNMKPLLGTGPISTADGNNPYTPLTPWLLYRFMVPPSARFLQTRDIAFAGILMNFSTCTTVLAQSIWISAYFNDQLPARVLPPLRPRPADADAEAAAEAKSVEAMRYETLLHARFGKWRYPAGHGSQFPDFVFDVVPYLDLLLSDLGLKVHRKNGWLAEATDPYGPEDYKDLLAEFMAKTGCS